MRVNFEVCLLSNVQNVSRQMRVKIQGQVKFKGGLNLRGYGNLFKILKIQSMYFVHHLLLHLRYLLKIFWHYKILTNKEHGFILMITNLFEENIQKGFHNHVEHR